MTRQADEVRRNCCCGTGVIEIVSSLSAFFEAFTKHSITCSFPYVLLFTSQAFNHEGKIYISLFASHVLFDLLHFSCVTKCTSI